MGGLVNRKRRARKGRDLRLKKGRFDAAPELGPKNLESNVGDTVDFLRAFFKTRRLRAAVRTECHCYSCGRSEPALLQAASCPCIGFPQRRECSGPVEIGSEDGRGPRIRRLWPAAQRQQTPNPYPDAN